jgi:protein SCO1/2
MTWCVTAMAGLAPAAPVEYRLLSWPEKAGTPDFRLVDFNGRPRTLADYRGQVVVIVFGFARCPDVCPLELAKLAAALKQLGADRSRVQVLFITLDPSRDTPDILKRYVTAFDPQFVGLTGTPAQVDATAGNFHVQYARVPSGDDYVIDHSTGLFVIDSAGQLRLLGAADVGVDDLAHDLGLLSAYRSPAR